MAAPFFVQSGPVSGEPFGQVQTLSVRMDTQLDSSNMNLFGIAEILDPD